MSTKAHRRPLNAVLPALGAAALVALSAGASHAASTLQQIPSATYNRLCPQLIGGDDEFNGNGPDVDVLLTLRHGATSVAADSVLLDVYMHAMETRSDWTEGELRITKNLGSAPTGRHFSHYWAPGPTGAFVWTPLGSVPTIVTKTISYIDTDTTLDRFYNPEWWLSEVAVNGDTPGGDVGGCSADDTYVNVRTPALWFLY
jgi:hypothetical protein